MLRACVKRATRDDETGVEAASLIFVVPLLVVFILGLLDYGLMIQTRLGVTSVVRNAARAAAYDGGNYNPRLNRTGAGRDTLANRDLVSSSVCTLGHCLAGQLPRIVCAPAIVRSAGDPVSCTVTYPYKPINGPLLDSPIFGLGIGSLLHPFTVTSVARAETGQG